jgi:hypothetical protein
MKYPHERKLKQNISLNFHMAWGWLDSNSDIIWCSDQQNPIDITQVAYMIDQEMPLGKYPQTVSWQIMN